MITSLEMNAIFGSPVLEASGVRLYHPTHAWSLADAIRFDTGHRPAILGRGWSQPESGGVWTDGGAATLHLGGWAARQGDASLVAINAFSYNRPNHRGQRVMASYAGQSLATWQVVDGVYYVRLPYGADELVLTLPDAVAPAAIVPGNTDSRRLGIAVRSISILRLVQRPTPPRIIENGGTSMRDAFGSDLGRERGSAPATGAR
jgi:hypothetical protein